MLCLSENEHFWLPYLHIPCTCSAQIDGMTRTYFFYRWELPDHTNSIVSCFIPSHCAREEKNIRMLRESTGVSCVVRMNDLFSRCYIFSGENRVAGSSQFLSHELVLEKFPSSREKLWNFPPDRSRFLAGRTFRGAQSSKFGSHTLGLNLLNASFHFSTGSLDKFRLFIQLRIFKHLIVLIRTCPEKNKSFLLKMKYGVCWCT